jgi:MerR family transcriptional regulator, redox-sensitive transcriptional activator SoxR
MAEYSVGDLARRAGVNASAVRFYERQGLLAPPPRRSGRRSYGPDDLVRLRAIAQGRAAGLALKEIRALLSTTSDPRALRAELSRAIRRVDDQIAAFTQLRALLEQASRCECSQPERCIASGRHGA